jgi:hypothetical protein
MMTAAYSQSHYHNILAIRAGILALKMGPMLFLSYIRDDLGATSLMVYSAADDIAEELANTKHLKDKELIGMQKAEIAFYKKRGLTIEDTDLLTSPEDKAMAMQFVEDQVRRIDELKAITLRQMGMDGLASVMLCSRTVYDNLRIAGAQEIWR